jgi:uncharacterized hydrophobic protein (TIGR00271 family)
MIEQPEELAPKPFHILTAVSSADDFNPLLLVSYAVARSQGGRLTILTIRSSGDIPDWLTLPGELSNSDIPVDIEVQQHESPAAGILDWTKQLLPDLLVVGWQGRFSKGRYLLGSTLDPLLQKVGCDLIVVKANVNWRQFTVSGPSNVLVPTAGGPNTPLALDIAFDAAQDGQVTATYVVPIDAEPASLQERYIWLKEITEAWTRYANFSTKIVQAESILRGVLTEAAKYELTILGTTQDSVFSQLIFGAIPHKIAVENQGPTILVKKYDQSVGSLVHRFWWRFTDFVPRLSVEERIEVYKQIRRSARPKIDFFMMIVLATGIAALGLLLDSPAVIIGAMLVAPLMSAIIGIGLAVIQADARLLGLAASATLRGVILAVGTGTIAGLALQAFSEPTHEILARTQPSLFDLGVAVISGLAGAYALCRKNMSASLPGVAIAVALVPPLATAGIGLSWLRWDIAGGASVLFLTNLISIVAAGGLVFFLLGFRPDLRRGRRLFSGGVISSFILLAIMTWVLWTLSYESYLDASRNRVVDQALGTHLTSVDPPLEVVHWTILGEDDGDLNLEVEVRSSRSTVSQRDIVALQSQIADDLTQAGTLATDRSLTLTLLIVPRMVFSAQNLPTPTSTWTLTPVSTTSTVSTVVPTTVFPSFTPSPTQPPIRTPLGIYTPTATTTSTIVPVTPAATVTATYASLDPPSVTATPTPVIAIVNNTTGRDVELRWTPGGAVAGVFPEGTILQMGHEQQSRDGVTWVKVTDVDGRNGWVVVDYLTPQR